MNRYIRDFLKSNNNILIWLKIIRKKYLFITTKKVKYITH